MEKDALKPDNEGLAEPMGDATVREQVPIDPNELGNNLRGTEFAPTDTWQKPKGKGRSHRQASPQNVEVNDDYL